MVYELLSTETKRYPSLCFVRKNLKYYRVVLMEMEDIETGEQTGCD